MPELSVEEWNRRREHTDDRDLCPCDAHPAKECETCRGACSCHFVRADKLDVAPLADVVRAVRDGEARDFTANIHKVWAKLAEADARRAGCVCSASVRADPSHDPSCRLRVRNAEPKD